MQIFVNIPPHGTVGLDMNPSDTIADVKTQLDKQHNTKSKDLTHDGRRLHNGLTLGDYNIGKESTLDVVLGSRGVMQIFVTIHVDTHKIITLDVLPTDTVDSVKTQIHQEEGIPTDQQRLVFPGGELEDEYTLGHYNIRCHDVSCSIHMTLKPREGVLCMSRFLG
eukprot:Selendium_serpulae@DN3558_c0_g1_i1.p1